MAAGVVGVADNGIDTVPVETEAGNENTDQNHVGIDENHVEGDVTATGAGMDVAEGTSGSPTTLDSPDA